MAALETAAAKALEKSLTTALAQLTKRLWTNRLSPAARREKAASDVIKQLTAHDFSGQLRLTAVLPELSTGISLKQVKAAIGGPTFQGLLHELVAARIMGMPELVVTCVRQNMEIAFRLAFPQSDPDRIAAFAHGLFDELDRVVADLAGKIDDGKGLRELREGAAVTLINAASNSIRRHNSHLLLPKTLAEAGAALDWEATYRNQARTAHGRIEPPDFERKRSVPIDSLFVSPRIRPRVDGNVNAVLDVGGLRNVIDRTVLLGDPGGGKSTATNMLAWLFAGTRNDLVPFVVVVRNSATQRRSILEQIESWLRSYYQSPAPPDAVEGLLLSGRALVVFDGLDELIDTSKRREMTERIELFCTRYPLAKVLVTSRRVGYEEAALDPTVFEVYELAEFSDDNVRTYVTNWFTQVGKADDDAAHELAASFIQESAAVPELRRNPLMLALMCIIYRGHMWIPRNRPEMYEHCAKLLFEKWDSSRQIYVGLKASAHVDGAIKQLAYWMFTDPEAAQGVRESELVREATTYLEPAFSTRPEAEQAAQQFIDFCRGRGWVLTDVGTTADGEALFAFTHRTFMEYFAAYELTRQHNGPEKVAKAILPHVAAAEWQIVAELAVQISNKHWRDGAARILRTILDNRRFSSVVSRHNITRFAIRCLGFAHIPVPLAAEIGQAFVATTLQFVAAGNLLRPERIAIVPELREPVENEILTALATAVMSNDRISRDVATEIVVHLYNSHSDEALIAPTPEDMARWHTHQQALFKAVRTEIHDRRDSSIWFMAWRQGLISIQQLVRESPYADQYPLSILFAASISTYTRDGWGSWGPFMARRLLQSGPEADDYSATWEEVKWLGHFMDTLGHPPWVLPFVHVRIGGVQSADLRLDTLNSDCGWALLCLMLIDIEATGVEKFLQPSHGDSRNYDQAEAALAWRRAAYTALPQWLSAVIDAMPAKRRDLVVAWLDNQVDFVVRE
ncbi:NACHT domain-containing protein [Actinocrispum wychmicini]|uniref:NACHT domain-containing protein n=1 Tax=Actinocrispum wychmicini TaxID=1213861 RepID=A0A4V2S749_9PSEU|nr:NACHT domain-containing protein [Actinocrispum wychmicini]TCO58530.1 NACHT domain-containing protein [Actinocrispum wychmicini]